MKSIFIIFLFFLSTLISIDCQAEFISKVSHLRGKAVQKSPGALTPRMLDKNINISNGTTIKTGEDSFVQLPLDVNGSIASIGPNSIVVIEKVATTNTFFFNLKHGLLRVRINDPHSTFKAIIRSTKTIVGIKEGIGLVMHNQYSRLTSLLSLKGDLIINKIREEDDPVMLRKSKWHKNKKKNIRQVGKNFDVMEDNSPITTGQRDVLTEVLSEEGHRVVKAGQYATSAISLFKISQPVKISPVQYKILYDNYTFKMKYFTKDFKKADLKNLGDELLKLKPSEQDAPNEGFYDIYSGEYAFKSGGVLDIESGIYIAPGDEADFNARFKVYLVEDFVNVDVETGQYIAPEGLGLHPSKGFLPLNSRFKKNDQVVKTLRTLNKRMHKDIVLARTPEKLKEKHEVYSSKKELYTKNQVVLNLKYSTYSLKISEDPLITSLDLSSIFALQADFVWYHSSNTKWQSITKVSNKSVNFSLPSTPTLVSESTNSLWSVGLGLKWFVSNSFNFGIEGLLDQNIYLLHPDETGTATNNLEKIVLTKLKTNIEWQIYRTERFSLNTGLGFMVALPKDLDQSASTGITIGTDYKVGFKWWGSTKWWTALDFWSENESQTIDYGDYDYSHKITNSGLALSFSRVY